MNLLASRIEQWNVYAEHEHIDCASCHSLYGYFKHSDTVVSDSLFSYHVQCAPRITLLIATLRIIVGMGIDRKRANLPY
jgi:hypothetical protein